MRRLLIAAVLLCLFGAWQYLGQRAVTAPPGVLAPRAPAQSAIADARELSAAGHRIRPLAAFSLQARVLAREDYRFDRESELAPTDLALGWGPMSDTAVLENLEIRQSGRWYTWRAEALPLPRREIELNSANMHLIPGDDTVADVLADVRPGMVVALEGYLVEAEGNDGWRWRSSLTRDDTGAGACELIWVERLRIL